MNKFLKKISFFVMIGALFCASISYAKATKDDLFKAINAGDIRAVEDIIKEKPSLISEKGPEKLMPAAHAANKVVNMAGSNGERFGKLTKPQMDKYQSYIEIIKVLGRSKPAEVKKQIESYANTNYHLQEAAKTIK
jgi:hypothetical protein